VIVPANESRLHKIIQALEDSLNIEAASILRKYASPAGTSLNLKNINVNRLLFYLCCDKIE